MLNVATRATRSVPLVRRQLRAPSSPAARPANFAVTSAVVAGRTFIVAAHRRHGCYDLTRLDNNTATSPVLRTVSAPPWAWCRCMSRRLGTAYVVGSSPSAQLVKVNVDTFRVLRRKVWQWRGTAFPRQPATAVVIANGSGVQVLDP